MPLSGRYNTKPHRTMQQSRYLFVVLVTVEGTASGTRASAGTIRIRELSARIASEDVQRRDLSPLVDVREHLADAAVVGVDQIEAIRADLKRGDE